MIENNPKEPMKIIITRSVFAKLAEDGKLQRLTPGDAVTMQAKYAHELISIRKAVIVGSTRHDAWVAREKAKAAQKKGDPKVTKLEQKGADQADTIADLEERLAEATKTATKK